MNIDDIIYLNNLRDAPTDTHRFVHEINHLMKKDVGYIYRTDSTLYISHLYRKVVEE